MMTETARDGMKAMYLSVVNDVELAEECWEELPDVLRLLTVLRHRELTQRFWHNLSDSMKCFCIAADDETLAAMAKTVIHDYVYPELSGFSFEHN
jgi:hypothetical protein